MGLSVSHVRKEFQAFFNGLFEVMFVGGKMFYLWMASLTLVILLGGSAYIRQLTQGMQVSNMNDQVSWGFYISNFTFLVGVAAAAVLLVIPAYLYHFKSIKRIVAFGELLAVTAVIMAMLFVLVDIGRPDRIWHMIVGLGKLNFPSSVLAWDVLVLNGYLFLNLAITTYIGSCTYFGREPNTKIVIPLILLSIPWAVGIHTVTAFLYNGLPARPFWNASILAPRFLASAFCAGPALMIIVFQLLRRMLDFKVSDRAILKLAEIIAYAMAINLFLLGAEIFKEYYSNTSHLAPMKYMLQGLHGHNRLVPWIWAAMSFNLVGFVIFLMPKTRKNFITLNIACVLIFVGIWIEKGMGLIVPGFIPDTLHEIYEYMPSGTEVLVGGGIWALGCLIYTLAIRAVVALDSGKLRHPEAPPLVEEKAEEGLTARDIMVREVVTVTPDTSLREVRSIMITRGLSGFPVVDAKNRVIGVVSESDIIFSEIHQEPHLVDMLANVIHPSAQAKKTPGEKVSEIMTCPAITTQEDASLRELSELLLDKKIKRVIVVNPENHPVGLVSRIDLVKAFDREGE
ncbi:MAG TPA: NrfD/PsrC family molybdoenzyme membrane anchor subunit [Malonomonas sp.]